MNHCYERAIRKVDGAEQPRYELSDGPGSPFYCDVATFEETVAIHPAWKEELHSHGFHTVLWFTAGRGTHIVDFEPHEVRPGRVFFLSADQVHTYSNMCGEAGVSLLLGRDALPLVNVQLARDFEFGLFNRYRSVPYCDVPPEAEDELRDLLDRIGREQRTGKFLDAHWDCLAAYLTLLFVFFRRRCVWPDSQKSQSQKQLHTFYRFQQLLEQHYKEALKVNDYAEMLGQSMRSLQRITSDVTGMTPLQVMHDWYILKAKRMLAYSDRPILEIVRELGLPDVNYFRRFFQRETHQWPEDFRRQWVPSMEVEPE